MSILNTCFLTLDSKYFEITGIIKIITMAGHSKFKNIMHRKGAQDKKKAKIFTKIIKEITVAVSMGSTDPNFNPRLRLAMLSARAANLPKDRIDHAIKKASSPADLVNYEEIRYEGYGASGIAFLVEALSDNRNRTASEVRSTFSKLGGALAETGSVSYMFEKLGIIIYPKSVKKDEEIFELAIEAEADDCQSTDTEHIIFCQFDKLHDVKESLELKIGEPSSAEIIWKSQNQIQLEDKESINKVLNLIEALEDLDDVQSVWTNLEVPSEIEDEE